MPGRNMKHVFITEQGNSEEIREKVSKIRKLDHFVYEVKEGEDVTSFVKEYLEKETEEKVVFYACEGDRMLNEVVNGIVGHPNAAVTVYPMDARNDYIKYFGGSAMFKNLNSLTRGIEVPVDVFKVNDRYALNVISFGYNGLTRNSLNNNCHVKVDGELLNPSGEYCLGTVSNGSFVDGQYNCAPLSIVNDGLAEVCLISNVTEEELDVFLDKYTYGGHLTDGDYDKHVTYCRGKKIELDSNEDMEISVDGINISGKHFEIENLECYMNFVIPDYDCDC